MPTCGELGDVPWIDPEYVLTGDLVRLEPLTSEHVTALRDAVAARTLDELRGRIDRLHEHGIRPGLGTIMVGANPGSMSYVAGKHRDSASIGLDSHRIDLPSSASAADIRAAILQMNDDPRVTAFIVQLPLPQGIDPTPMLELMDPAKDADGLHPTNLGELVLAMFKALLFGLLAGLVGCYRGLTVQGGPKGVGIAVNETVVYAFICLFVVNVILTAVGVRVLER